jgi:hypothetical protein
MNIKGKSNIKSDQVAALVKHSKSKNFFQVAKNGVNPIQAKIMTK